jgi:hypothetical protein
LPNPFSDDRPTVSFLPSAGIPIAAIQSTAAISRRRLPSQRKTTILIINNFGVSYITSSNNNFIINCLVTSGTEIEIAEQ